MFIPFHSQNRDKDVKLETLNLLQTSCKKKNKKKTQNNSVQRGNEVTLIIKYKVFYTLYTLYLICPYLPFAVNGVIIAL